MEQFILNVITSFTYLHRLQTLPLLARGSVIIHLVLAYLHVTIASLATRLSMEEPPPAELLVLHHIISEVDLCQMLDELSIEQLKWSQNLPEKADHLALF